MNRIFFDFNQRKTFPDPSLASPLNDYCLGYGGGLSVDRLIAAYKKGLFPWYTFKGDPYWFCPDPRCILLPDELHISKSMKQLIRSNTLSATFDHDFKSVIKNCASVKRKHDKSTWITSDLKNAFIQLHKAGYAHSVEVWEQKKLVGGLYGVSLGKCFFGESMFSKVNNASKYGFIFLTEQLKKLNFNLIDCQIYNPHLGTLGAKNISREDFLIILQNNARKKTISGSWQFIEEL